MARPKRKILDPVPGTGVGPHKKHTGGSWWGIDQNHDAITTLIGKGAGEAVNFYGKVVDNPIAERVTNGLLMKGWRALLFTNRAGITHQVGLISDPANVKGENYAAKIANRGSSKTKALHDWVTDDFNKYREENFEVPALLVGHDATELMNRAEEAGYSINYQDLTGKTSKYEKNLNQVIIYNETELAQGLEEPFIALQLRPQEIEAKPETSWAAIKSMGRNLPMYHYLGGEEALHININWFLKGDLKDNNPYYVVNQCRRLKSWTFANSYISSPPILRIQWGLGDIFQNEYWILTSASYNLRDFHDVAVVKKYKEWNPVTNLPLSEKEIEIINSGLIPYSATQELIFKRVADHNLFSTEFLNYQQPQ